MTAVPAPRAVGSDAPIAAAPPPTPLRQLGFIGDTRTGALVSAGGAIEWLCLPTFDGDPMFAALVAGPDGGSFQIAPAGASQALGQRYDGEGTVLVTRWRTDGSEICLRDAMVSDVGGRLLPSTLLVRHVAVDGAPADVVVDLDPVLDGHRRPRRSRRAGTDLFSWSDRALSVGADRELDGLGQGPVRVRVEPHRPLTIVLTSARREPAVIVPTGAALHAVDADQRWWRDFAGRLEYDGPWRDAVVRSAITLKLLTFSPTGAPVAAPTTSLPEQRGGDMNWDYRYAWFRDAGLGVGTFLGLGLEAEARQFLYWMLHATRRSRPRIPPALTLYGNPIPRERTRDWPGWADSRPVRFGNVVSEQRQLDVYGFVLDAASLLVDRGQEIYADTWRALRGAADHVVQTWREPGSGIWELRGEPRQWVQSKMMAWLAIDRAQRIGRERRESPGRLHRWERAKHEIHEDVLTHGYDAERGTFLREYGGADLDGSLLLLPLIGMEEPMSPRVVGTVDAVRRELHAGGPYFRRHGDGDEGAFLAVSFWMAQALARTGRVDEAAELIDDLVTLGGTTGVLSEEADPATGELLGNHPQALTHAALLQAVLAVREASG